MNLNSLHQILSGLYDSMIPLCSGMIGAAKGIAALGALFYIAYRIWKPLSTGEPIEVFALLRPFAIGICIMFFPTIVLGTINGVLSPVVSASHRTLESQTLSMENLKKERDELEKEALLKNPETAYLVDNKAFDEKLDKLGVTDVGKKAGLYIERGMYKVKKWLQQAFQDILELLFEAAALTLDTIRTFFLIVLAILGPIAFAISVWDGFKDTLSRWIMRYICIYLWLPVSDLFSSILARLQSQMLEHDISQINSGQYSFDGANVMYLIFMIIGIVGYFCVPTVSSWIVSSSGGGVFTRHINHVALKVGAGTAAFAGALVGNIASPFKGGRSSNNYKK